MQNPVTISESIDGTATLYTIIFSAHDTGDNCAIISFTEDSFQDGQYYSELLNSTSMNCSQCSSITVSSFATNILGDGPISTTGPYETGNRM